MKRDPNIEAYRLLRRFVPELRRFVKNQLVRCYGEAWVEKGIPEAIANQCRSFGDNWAAVPWVATQTDSLLDFSYEGDLKSIMLSDDNWKRIFSQFFGSDRKHIATRLDYINWVRDHIAHFRPVAREDLHQLGVFCQGIWNCISRAAAIQADSNAPEGLLSPDDLLSGKEVAELVTSWVGANAKGAQDGSVLSGPETEETQRGIEKFLLENEFDLGAAPPSLGVQLTRFHRFDDAQWPDDEASVWQTYAPRESVVRGREIHLAIRYNPLATKAPPALREGMVIRRRSAACLVQPIPDIGVARSEANVDALVEVRGMRIVSLVPATERKPSEWELVGRVVVDPGAWAFVQYVPQRQGLHWVEWFGTRPKPHEWTRDLFWVE